MSSIKWVRQGSKTPRSDPFGASKYIITGQCKPPPSSMERVQLHTMYVACYSAYAAALAIGAFTPGFFPRRLSSRRLLFFAERAFVEGSCSHKRNLTRGFQLKKFGAGKAGSSVTLIPWTISLSMHWSSLVLPMGLEQSSRCSWHLRDSTLVVRNQAMLSNVADEIGTSASHLPSAVRVSDHLSEAARTSGKVGGKIHLIGTTSKLPAGSGTFSAVWTWDVGYAF